MRQTVLVYYFIVLYPTGVDQILFFTKKSYRSKKRVFIFFFIHNPQCFIVLRDYRCLSCQQDLRTPTVTGRMQERYGYLCRAYVDRGPPTGFNYPFISTNPRNAHIGILLFNLLLSSIDWLLCLQIIIYFENSVWLANYSIFFVPGLENSELGSGYLYGAHRLG